MLDWQLELTGYVETCERGQLESWKVDVQESRTGTGSDSQQSDKVQPIIMKLYYHHLTA